MTEASRHFLDRSEAYNREAHAAFCALDPPVRVLGDADEWGAWDSLGDPVLHIEVLQHVRPVILARPARRGVFQLYQAINSHVASRHSPRKGTQTSGGGGWARRGVPARNCVLFRYWTEQRAIE